jgi:hypothetical protein
MKRDDWLPVIYMIVMTVLAVAGIIWTIRFYTASCEDFKHGLLQYGYAPARCILWEGPMIK